MSKKDRIYKVGDRVRLRKDYETFGIPVNTSGTIVLMDFTQGYDQPGFIEVKFDINQRFPTYPYLADNAYYTEDKLLEIID